MNAARSACLILLCLGALFPQAGSAQGRAPLPEMTLRFQDPAPGSDSLVLAVGVFLPPGWYINSNAPLDSFLVPTTVEAAAAPTAPGETGVLRFGTPRWPEPVIEHSDAMAGNMSLFKGSFVITIPARIGKEGKRKVAPPSTLPPTRVTLNYQSCDGTMCWPPKSVSAVLVDGVTRRE
jgi:hypothetical protein